MHLIELVDRVIREQETAGRKPYALLLGADVYRRLCVEVELSGIVMIKPQSEVLSNTSYRGLVILEGMIGEFRVLSLLRS